MLRAGQRVKLSRPESSLDNSVTAGTFDSSPCGSHGNAIRTNPSWEIPVKDVLFFIGFFATPLLVALLIPALLVAEYQREPWT